MDEIDIEILEVLKRDSRTKYVEIAEMVGLTEGAVRRRVKKMVEQGIIRKFTIEAKAEVEAVILVKTDPTQTRNVALRIKDFSEKVFEVSGDYDVAAWIQAYTIEKLNEKVDQIRNLPSVLETSTLVKLVSD
ncbi:winged helix-turn-helix transcriptional regulator [Candidatus Bathyarchaeota archaeon]|nr:winged helix-turn-helix transcriptional regulator [Candidatus Bathyarchaeota archaeon]